MYIEQLHFKDIVPFLNPFNIIRKAGGINYSAQL